jgi:hypothetical protein
VKFEERELIRDSFWQLMKVDHPNMLLTAPARSFSEETYMYEMEIRTWSRSAGTVEDILSSSGFTLVQWLELMVQAC